MFVVVVVGMFVRMPVVGVHVGMGMRVPMIVVMVVVVVMVMLVVVAAVVMGVPRLLEHLLVLAFLLRAATAGLAHDSLPPWNR